MSAATKRRKTIHAKEAEPDESGRTRTGACASSSSPNANIGRKQATKRATKKKKLPTVAQKRDREKQRKAKKEMERRKEELKEREMGRKRSLKKPNLETDDFSKKHN